jgi:hydrogen peroxide-dependent heme synthase
MAAPPNVHAETASVPPVPLTIEGSPVLHQMFRFKWNSWKRLDAGRQQEIASEAAVLLSSAQTGLYSMLGHKGDLLFVHFRDTFEELNQVELKLARLDLSEYLEPATSYVSVVELGLYESTSKVYSGLTARGIQPHSEEWNKEIEDTLNRQREAMRPRLYPEIPPSRYICFYPMDRKRGEQKNWYERPMPERQRMMREHGLVGRRYAGQVMQVISGSIGLDDWEWGVTLFADDPVIFKKLIYEMRFDEVSAAYALFGSFYVGIRVPAAQLTSLLSGELIKNA